MNQHYKKTLIVSGTVIVALILIIGAYAYFNQNSNSLNHSTIQAEGTSELTVAPDSATVYVGVSMAESTAQQAQDEVNGITNQVISGLNQIGINSSDIQTDSVSLNQQFCDYPVYNGVSGVASMPMEPTGYSCNSTGWTASQTLEVKTTDLTKVGTIVDVSVKNGANQVNNVYFSLSPSKENEYKIQAIQQATENAKTQAEAMASGAGSRLGKVVSITNNQYSEVPYVYAMKNMAGSAAAQESATILPQDVTISADISVVYDIN